MWRLVKITTFVFCGDRLRPHFWVHKVMVSRLFWRRFAAVERDFVVTHIAPSSAYKEVCTSCGRSSKISFIATSNRIGLRTDPCGTPECSGRGLELVVASVT